MRIEKDIWVTRRATKTALYGANQRIAIITFLLVGEDSQDRVFYPLLISESSRCLRGARMKRLMPLTRKLAKAIQDCLYAPLNDDNFMRHFPGDVFPNRFWYAAPT